MDFCSKIKRAPEIQAPFSAETKLFLVLAIVIVLLVLILVLVIVIIVLVLVFAHDFHLTLCG